MFTKLTTIFSIVKNETKKIHWIYLFLFLIPFTIRIIPELLNPYLLGPDTAWYVFLGKQLTTTSTFEWEGYQSRFGLFSLLLAALNLVGVNLELFMKIYPSVNYALITFLLSLYAKKSFADTPVKLFVTSMVISLFPAWLRMSWDLHRQNFALVFLCIMLLFNLDNLEIKSRKYFAVLFLLGLMGLGHEMVLAIAFTTLIYRALREMLFKNWSKCIVYSSLAFLPIICYIIAVFIALGRPPDILGDLIVTNYIPEAIGDFSFKGPIDWWLTIFLLSFGPFIPVSILGFYHDKNLSPWLAITLFGYASYLISPIASFNYPERWLLLAGLPLAIYASKYIGKQSRLKSIALLTILSIQGLSMIGVFKEPLSIFGGQRYGAMIDILTTPDSPEVIASLYDATDWIKNNSDSGSVIVPPQVRPYTQYLLGIEYTVIPQDDVKLKTVINSFLNGTLSSIYYISYSERPIYPIPLLNKSVNLKTVHIIFPLQIYEVIAITP